MFSSSSVLSVQMFGIKGTVRDFVKRVKPVKPWKKAFWKKKKHVFAALLFVLDNSFFPLTLKTDVTLEKANAGRSSFCW